ncbi:putative acyl-CoA synthetase-like protein [Emericellopsis cladophorae]|uniref:Acyl-CoA synthetase-like protein n=1 Tax=Emericellopsis cladophorae TaxID=2686198 RepID=A0A9P9Y689_9HYPO|nr:putative acyl-CoA synthetase-like protein [Emericellopsis cladophorae]KAI6784256.1 putative acyl-CoA synthetase-like protein [Emericellopsis cladophorae]
MLLSRSGRCLPQRVSLASLASSVAVYPPSSHRWYSADNTNLSYRRGPTTPELFRGTIPEHFARTVSAHGDRPAVIARSPIPSSSSGISAPETRLTYYDLDMLSNRLASSLADLGVSKGDRVAVSLGNGAPFAALTYALFKLGAVLVPLNPTFTSVQVSAALKHLEAEVLIMGAVTDLAYRPGKGRSNESLIKDVAGDIASSTIQSEAVPSLRKVVVLDNRASHQDVSFPLERYPALTPYGTLLSGSSGPVTPSTPLSPSDTINIQFTSGTTSMPKAAMLSHTSILNNGRFIAHRMGLEPSDLIVVPPPLFHCFGCVLGYMATATTGAAILFPSPAFDPVATVKMSYEHDATGLYGVSTMLLAVLESLDKGIIPSAPKNLRKGIAAGSSVPSAVMEKVQSKLGLQDLVICYGMTETSPVSCMTKPSDPFTYRTTSVGTVMPHTGVKIVSPTDRDTILPIGEKGELAAAGYLTMKGYFNDPDKTAEVRVPDPETGEIWIYSGDEAEMSPDGYVTITGRIKDLIIRAGENIHPLEIENALFTMPGVQEVSVVGVPDEKLGEAVAAFIICSDGSTGRTVTDKSVRDWVKDRLSGHLVPKWVFWVDAYPKTASGKIQKFKLRELAGELMKSSK